MFEATLDLETVLRDDPLLPAELVGDGWGGSRARRAFMAAHAEVSARSELFSNSQLMQSYTTEIERSVGESSESFWTRWMPRLIEAYKARLPPAATA